MELNIMKTQPHDCIPETSRDEDAGTDLRAVEIQLGFDESGNSLIEVDFGIAAEIPQGYAALILPRSSISKTGYHLSNSPGLIDPGYRGSWKAKFKSGSDATKSDLEYFKIGNRVAQFIIVKYEPVKIQLVDKLSQTQRGTGGFGSTGLK